MMSDDFLSLDPEFSVEHPELDRQHMHIIDFANGYLDQIRYIQREEPRREVMLEMFSGVIVLLTKHYEFEESLLEQTSYPLLKQHKIEHQNIVNYLNVMLGRLENGGSVNLPSVIKTMQTQSSAHFKIFDHGYVPYLKELDTKVEAPKKQTQI